MERIKNERIAIYKQLVFEGAALALLHDIYELIEYQQRCLHFLDKEEAHHDPVRVGQMMVLLTRLRLRGHSYLAEAERAAADNPKVARRAYAGWLRMMEDSIASALKLRAELPDFFPTPPQAASWDEMLLRVRRAREQAEAPAPASRFTLAADETGSDQVTLKLTAPDVQALSELEYRTLRQLVGLLTELMHLEPDLYTEPAQWPSREEQLENLYNLLSQIGPQRAEQLRNYAKALAEKNSSIQPEKADEMNHRKVLSFEEEKRILALCTGPRAICRTILITALDTGMRRGELFKMKWHDIDWKNRWIYVRAENSKTMRERVVPISNRMFDALSFLRKETAEKLGERIGDRTVFGMTGWVQKQIKLLAAEANVPDFRLHDCRHTFATRLIQAGMPPDSVARLLGQSRLHSTYRHIRQDDPASANW